MGRIISIEKVTPHLLRVESENGTFEVVRDGGLVHGWSLHQVEEDEPAPAPVTKAEPAPGTVVTLTVAELESLLDRPKRVTVKTITRDKDGNIRRIVETEEDAPETA